MKVDSSSITSWQHVLWQHVLAGLKWLTSWAVPSNSLAEKVKLQAGPGVVKIVLSGGPCAGKTESTKHLIKKYNQGRTRVLVVAEVATFIAKSGGFIDMSAWDKGRRMDFQTNLLITQINLENDMVQVADQLVRLGQCDRVFVICDRGLIDGKAYIDEPMWFDMLDSLGLEERQVCEERYHIAVLMETAAIGAVKFYDLANIRYENVDQAIRQHYATARVWDRHPNLKKVLNEGTTCLEDKLAKLDAIIEEYLDSP